MKLYYIIIGAEPKGRNIEQHDVFFGIANTLKDLIPEMKDFWPETNGKIHIDCYQEVSFVDGYQLKIIDKTSINSDDQLFFINLGGYQKGKFEEFHQQYLMVGKSMAEIISRVKKTDFYTTMGFKNATSHVDDKHGVDIDDIFRVNDILPVSMKEKYSIILEKTDEVIQENFMHIGYLSLSKISKT
jgi:hypothetical protein